MRDCRVQRTGNQLNAVADLAIGLMLAVTRNIVIANNRVRNGEWKPAIGVDVCFKTLGIFGFGAIAKNVARRANGFGMKVLAYDPYVKEVPEEFKSFVTLCSIDEIIKNADIISMHLPLTDETKRHDLRKRDGCHEGGALTSSTPQEAVSSTSMTCTRAVKSGHIAGAALDVSEQEPMAEDNPLRTLENVIITPISVCTLRKPSALSA